MLALRVASALSKSLLQPSGAAQRRLGAAAACFSTKYTKQHEYITVEGKVGTIGITDFAQNSLGDVVYVDLPAVGDHFTKGCVYMLTCMRFDWWLMSGNGDNSAAFGAVESVKAASDVYVPAAGTVTAVNEVRFSMDASF